MSGIEPRSSSQEFHPTRRGVLLNPDYIIRSRLRRQIAALAPRIQGDVLDIGCGSKPYEELFGHCTGYLGVDIEVSGHDHSTSRVDVFYDGRTLPFPDNRFDSAVSFEVFEHVFNLPELLLEVARVVKPGGSLLISTPFAYPEHEQPYDFARYTRFGIEHLLTQAGFSVVVIRPTTSTVLAVAQLMNTYLLSRRGAGRLLARMLVPVVTLVALALDRLLPTNNDLYCNLVTYARKTDAPDSGPSR